jgi:hypothetical protein
VLIERLSGQRAVIFTGDALAVVTHGDKGGDCGHISEPVIYAGRKSSGTKGIQMCLLHIPENQQLLGTHLPWMAILVLLSITPAIQDKENDTCHD